MQKSRTKKIMKIMSFFSKERNIIIAILLFSILIRVGYLSAFGLADFTAKDSLVYNELAENMNFFERCERASFLKAPTIIYPLFLSAIYSIFGFENHLAVALIQIIIDSLTVIILYRITKEIFSKKAAIFTAIFAVFNLDMLLWAPHVLTDTVFLFILSLTIYVLITNQKKPTENKTIACAALLFIGFLTRPVMAVIILAAILWILLASRSKKVLTSIFILILAVFFFLTVYNAAYKEQFGTDTHITKPIEQKTSFALTLYKKLALNSFKEEPWGGKYAEIQGPLRRNFKDESEKLPPAEREEFYKSRIKEINLPKMMIKKFYLLWTPVLPYFSTKHKILGVLYFIPLYVFALLGLVLTPRKNWKRPLLLLFIFATISFLHMITHVDWDQRYRLPAMPVLLVFAGYGASIAYDTIKKNGYWRLKKFLIACS